MAKLDEDDLRLQEYHNKRVAFFDSWIKAWIQNRMELDRQLLSLSALAIGLLVGVLGNPNNVLQFIIWFIAGFSFLFCGGLILIIFRQNTKYIETLLDDHQTEEKAEEKVVLSEREKQKTQQLGLLTKSAFLLFLFGEKALEYGNRIAPKPPPPSRLPNNGQGSGKKNRTKPPTK